MFPDRTGPYMDRRAALFVCEGPRSQTPSERQRYPETLSPYFAAHRALELGHTRKAERSCRTCSQVMQQSGVRHQRPTYGTVLKPTPPFSYIVRLGTQMPRNPPAVPLWDALCTDSFLLHRSGTSFSRGGERSRMLQEPLRAHIQVLEGPPRHCDFCSWDSCHICHSRGSSWRNNFPARLECNNRARW